MKKISSFTCLLFWVGMLPGFGQKSQFAVGLASSYDVYLSPANLPRTTFDMKYFPSVGYGVDLSYQRGNLLFGARLLTSARRYDQILDVRPVDPNDYLITTRAKNRVRYYSVPLTVSYQLSRSNKLQIFGGLGVVTEWAGRTIRVETENSGGVRYNPVPSLQTEPNALVGGSLQATVRYHLTNALFIQVEPVLRYYPQEQSTFYNKPGATANALLSVGWKL